MLEYSISTERTRLSVAKLRKEYGGWAYADAVRQVIHICLFFVVGVVIFQRILR